MTLSIHILNACNHRGIKIILPEMADRWIEELRCPMCYRAARAELSQEDYHTPVADRVPEGFQVIRTRHSIDFICSSCRVRVEP